MQLEMVGFKPQRGEIFIELMINEKNRPRDEDEISFALVSDGMETAFANEFKLEYKPFDN